ncbi:MAG: hypothetical protein WD904_09095 [Dehalococcoidia bacterium]
MRCLAHRRTALPGLALIIAIAGIAAAWAAAGDLNNDFSGDGKVSTDMRHAISTAEALALQPDGKVLVGGYASGNYSLARLNADGMLDTSFADGGFGLYDFGDDFNEFLYDLALQDNGQILGVGRTAAGMAVMKWNANGSVDTSFGDNGQAVFDEAGTTDGYGIALQTDGKIIAVGRTNPGTSGGGFAMARFNPDGTLDATFAGNGGFADNTNEGPRGLVIDDQDRIITVGGTTSFAASGDVVVQRFNPDGTPDNTFDGDGRVEQDINGSFDRALSVALQGDGKILIAGQTNPGTINWLVARFNADGSLDTSFAGDGSLERDFNAGNDAATAITVFDSRIAVSGYVLGDAFTTAILMSDGTPDTSFSGDGFVQTEIGASGFQIPSDVIVRDGQTVLIGGGDGTMSVLAYKLDGTLDPGFSEDGGAFFQMPGGHDSAAAVIQQPDGKILAIGNAVNETGIVRYNADGSLDTTFGDAGRLIINLVPGSIEAPSAAVLQPDGKFVVTGSDLFVARFNPDGTLDPSFAGDGVLEGFDVFPDADEGNDIALQPDGKIVIAGTGHPNFTDDFAVYRLNPDGTPDTTFSGDGAVYSDFFNVPDDEKDDEAFGLLLAGDRIVAGGYTLTADNMDVFAIASYNSNGTPDTSFSGDGEFIVPFQNDARAADLALMENGSYIFAGFHESSTEEFALVAVMPNGTLDSSFDGDGKLLFDPGADGGQTTTVAVQPNGKIVAGGYLTHSISVGDMIVARFNADGTPDTTFSGDGLVQIDFLGLEDWLLDLFIRGDTTIIGSGYAYSAITQRDIAVIQIEGDQQPQTPVPTEPPGEERTWGDNNCSGDTPNPVDGLFALRFDGGLPTNTGDCPDMGDIVEVAGASPHPWGDVDCGGAVNPVDSLKLLRFDGGLSVTQPTGCPAIGDTVIVSAE